MMRETWKYKITKTTGRKGQEKEAKKRNLKIKKMINLRWKNNKGESERYKN
jgi:hypothetical protein